MASDRNVVWLPSISDSASNRCDFGSLFTLTGPRIEQRTGKGKRNTGMRIPGRTLDRFGILVCYLGLPLGADTLFYPVWVAIRDKTTQQTVISKRFVVDYCDILVKIIPVCDGFIRCFCLNTRQFRAQTPNLYRWVACSHSS